MAIPSYIKTVDSTRRNQCIPLNNDTSFNLKYIALLQRISIKPLVKLALPAMMAQGNESETYLNLGWTGPHITFGSGYDVAVGCP